MANLNVLSRRYATPEINEIFSERGTAIAERELWIAVMKAQSELGVDIPSDDIEKFEKAKEDVDLARIDEIERVTRHDIKAKIQAFVEVAGAGEHVHKGMTARDLTDNVEQTQIRRAAEVILKKNVAVLKNLVDRAEDHRRWTTQGRLIRGRSLNDRNSM